MNIIKLSEFSLDKCVFQIGDIIVLGSDLIPKKEELQIPKLYTALSLFNLEYSSLIPEEVWVIIGKLYRKLLFDEIIYRLRRFNRSSFSLSMSGDNVILRTHKRKLYNTTNKIFRDIIHTSISHKEGPWLCTKKHVLIGENETPKYTEEEMWAIDDHCGYSSRIQNGKCCCDDGCGYSKITNYEITFVDMLCFKY